MQQYFQSVILYLKIKYPIVNTMKIDNKHDTLKILRCNKIAF